MLNGTMRETHVRLGRSSDELELKRKSLGGFIYKCDRFDYVNL